LTEDMNARGKVKPAKMILKINDEEYIAYGVLDEQRDYIAFEVELLIKNNGKKQQI